MDAGNHPAAREKISVEQQGEMIYTIGAARMIER
jgi:hypothetical protein